jgi:hypothetical protein
MENNQEQLQTNAQLIEERDSQELIVSKKAMSFLLETAKWTKFLSILGFVFIGFMVLGAVFVGFAGIIAPGLDGPAGAVPFGLISFMYLIFAGVYFIPILYLYNFSVNVKQAFLQVNQATFEAALEKLKSHYKFVGITAIVIIGLYILIIIVALIGGAAFLAMQ